MACVGVEGICGAGATGAGGAGAGGAGGGGWADMAVPHASQNRAPGLMAAPHFLQLPEELVIACLAFSLMSDKLRLLTHQYTGVMIDITFLPLELPVGRPYSTNTRKQPCRVQLNSVRSAERSSGKYDFAKHAAPLSAPNRLPPPRRPRHRQPHPRLQRRRRRQCPAPPCLPFLPGRLLPAPASAYSPDG